MPYNATYVSYEQSTSCNLAFLTYLLIINHLQQNPWKCFNRSFDQDIHQFLWNQNVITMFTRGCNWALSFSSQLIPVHRLTPDLSHFNIILQSMPMSLKQIPSFQVVLKFCRTCAFIIYYIRLTSLDFITLIILGKKYCLQPSSTHFKMCDVWSWEGFSPFGVFTVPASMC